MIQYPDVSHFQAGLTIQPGTPALIAKATQGTSFTDPAYPDFKSQAARVGAVFGAYHWLEHGNVTTQALHCFSVVGKTPVMIDAEETSGATLTVADITGFIDSFRSRGGIVSLLYLPRWYWANDMGSPSLAPIKSRGIHLVSSDYSGYSATGPGWSAYGGMTPEIWQYTDAQSYGGKPVDFNAYKGTVQQFAAILGGNVASVDDVYAQVQGLRSWVSAFLNDKTGASFPIAEAIYAGAAPVTATLTDAQITALAAQVTASHPKLGAGDEPAIVAALKTFFTPSVSG